jgi:hypothetical protein
MGMDMLHSHVKGSQLELPVILVSFNLMYHILKKKLKWMSSSIMSLCLTELSRIIDLFRSYMYVWAIMIFRGAPGVLPFLVEFESSLASAGVAGSSAGRAC